MSFRGEQHIKNCLDNSIYIFSFRVIDATTKGLIDINEYFFFQIVFQPVYVELLMTGAMACGMKGVHFNHIPSEFKLLTITQISIGQWHRMGVSLSENYCWSSGELTARSHCTCVD